MPVSTLLLALALAPVAQALNLCDVTPTSDEDDKCFGKDADPCDSDCGCLMRVGQFADPDANVPKLTWGVPGIRPLSPSLQGGVFIPLMRTQLLSQCLLLAASNQNSAVFLVRAPCAGPC